MEVTFGRESHPSREGPPATLITHYQCHHPEHTIHVHSVLSVPSFYTLWTNIKTISTIVRPPSQSNYNHPSSTSGPTPSLDILLLHLLFLFLLLLLFIFLSVLSIISVRLSLISKLKGPGWLLHRCGLVWSITPLGSPMVSRGHTGWLILSPVDSQELLVVDLPPPLSLLTPFLFYSTRVSVRYDPLSDTSEPVTEQSLLEKACWQYQHQHFGRDAVITWCGPNAPDLKVGSNSRCED